MTSEIMLLLLLGAWTAADTTAALQLMVSQPLVAGWIAGAIVGNPAAGLGVGILLQFLWGRCFPLGGSSFPWAGPAATVGAAIAAWAARGEAFSWGRAVFPSAFCLAGALITAWLVGEAGRRVIRRFRDGRDSLVVRAVAAAAAGLPRRLVAINARGGLQDGAAGLALTAAGLATGWVLVRLLGQLPPVSPLPLAAVAFAVGWGQTLEAVAPGRKAWGATTLGVVGVLGWRMLG